MNGQDISSILYILFDIILRDDIITTSEVVLPVMLFKSLYNDTWVKLFAHTSLSRVDNCSELKGVLK